MIDVVYFCLGAILALLFNYSRNSDDDKSEESLQLENQELKAQIEYYKDLCKWHVEERQKLKQEHYINE